MPALREKSRTFDNLSLPAAEVGCGGTVQDLLACRQSKQIGALRIGYRRGSTANCPAWTWQESCKGLTECGNKISRHTALPLALTPNPQPFRVRPPRARVR